VTGRACCEKLARRARRLLSGSWTSKASRQAPAAPAGPLVVGAWGSHRTDMLPRALADLVLLVHAAFVLFVVLGGFAVLRWPRLAWIHLPAAAWGAVIEFAGWICPLTPLENRLRGLAGDAGYPGGFVEHYLLAWLYPAALDRSIQVGLGLAVIAVNLVAYGWVAARRRTQTTRR
jgi:hypothetical protein